MSGVEGDALHFIAEGVTAMTGFSIAAISIVEGDQLRVVAVAGHDEAAAELMELRTPTRALLDELEPADHWGRFTFLPHDRSGGHLTDFMWVPDLDVVDELDAWHPEDLLCALLHDEHGTLRGVLSVDLPTNGRRPDQHQRDVLDHYASRAERAVVNLLERSELAHDLEVERRVSRHRSQLIEALSHELQTPSTVILGRAEVALDEAVDPHLRRNLEAIARAATRISTMADDLLVMARVEHPERQFADVAVDLAGVAHDAFEMLLDGAATRGIALTAHAPDPTTMTGNRGELEALVINLMTNAIKYTDTGGCVAVAVTVDDDRDRVLLTVTDDGIGISDDDRHRLFEEFFRSPSPDARERPGTGLGLAIVERVVRRHRGRIDVDSELGRGTTVRVVLPRS